jgi:isopenicillin-N N-acyltransferase like protein
VSIPHHHSTEATPGDRGRGLGAAQADRIASNAEIYLRLFNVTAGITEAEVLAFGADALVRIAEHAPDLADEIAGIASGSGRSVELIGALNARTELLCAGNECSMIACMGTATADGNPIGIQTWDWHDELADSWMHWTIEHSTGHRVETLTEAGIVGKLGVSSAGVGILMNILGHRSDGPPIGVPVHVLNRSVLDYAANGVEAITMLSNAEMSASSAVTVIADDLDGGNVCTVELSGAGPGFVMPDERGVLVHTNHFLAEPGRSGDTDLRLAPNTVLRLDHAQRAMRRIPEGEIDQDAILGAMHSHQGGGPGGICCHPSATAPFGDRWRTLATVIVEPVAGRLTLRRNGPCGHIAIQPELSGVAAGD